MEEENKRKQEEERKAQDLIDKGKPPVINPDPNAKQPYSLVKKGAVTVGILCGLYELYSIAKQYKKVCHEAIENEALQNKNLFLVALGRECARWKDPCAGFLWSNAEDDEAAEKEKIAEKETDAEEGA